MIAEEPTTSAVTSMVILRYMIILPCLVVRSSIIARGQATAAARGAEISLFSGNDSLPVFLPDLMMGTGIVDEPAIESGYRFDLQTLFEAAAENRIDRQRTVVVSQNG